MNDTREDATLLEAQARIIGLEQINSGYLDELATAQVENARYRADRNLLYAELKEAHTWLEGAGIDDCEHRGYEGTKLCRFAAVLRALEGPADA